MKHPLLIIGFLLMLILPVTATVSTGAATMVGSNNASISCLVPAGTWWVEWGQTDPMYWKSSNQSSTLATYRIHKSPLFGSSYFYYRCCDATGCGSTLNFTTAAVTPIPSVALGGMYENMTENGFDIPMMAANLLTPYLWIPNMPLTIVFMLIFSPMFIGIWLRSRTVIVAMIFGFITGTFILSGAGGLGISMPAELVSIAQAFCYISFAGAVLYIVHR